MITGNAAEDGKDMRGWFIGHFMKEGSPLRTDELEVKWGVERAGTTKAGAGVNTVAKTLTLLVSGEFHIRIDDTKVVLKKPGDYTFHGPGEAHAWHAVTDCVIVSVRWPSLEGDQTIAA